MMDNIDVENLLLGYRNLHDNGKLRIDEYQHRVKLSEPTKQSI